MICIVVWLQVHLNSLYCLLCGPRLEDNMRRLGVMPKADGGLQTESSVLLFGFKYMYILYCCVAASI